MFVKIILPDGMQRADGFRLHLPAVDPRPAGTSLAQSINGQIGALRNARLHMPLSKKYLIDKAALRRVQRRMLHAANAVALK